MVELIEVTDVTNKRDSISTATFRYLLQFYQWVKTTELGSEACACTLKKQG